MASIMPAHVNASSMLEEALLIQLGDRLASARKARGLSAVALAAGLGISRNTLKAVESGEASATIGTYLRVLAALGFAGDLALVASGAAAPVAKDLAQLHLAVEQEVARGARTPESLFTLPSEAVKQATLVFPEAAFGKAQPW